MVYCLAKNSMQKSNRDVPLCVENMFFPNLALALVGHNWTFHYSERKTEIPGEAQGPNTKYFRMPVFSSLVNKRLSWYTSYYLSVGMHNFWDWNSFTIFFSHSLCYGIDCQVSLVPFVPGGVSVLMEVFHIVHAVYTSWIHTVIFLI